MKVFCTIAIVSTVCCLYVVAAQSTTTAAPDTEQCITSCEGRQDGDYQSCQGCHVHVTCVKGVFFDNRPCFGGHVWDDSLKMCAEGSLTCQTRTGAQCITGCAGLASGDYQSCSGCNVYATCVAGFIIDNRPCGHGLRFNANTQTCDFVSPTCNE